MSGNGRNGADATDLYQLLEQHVQVPKVQVQVPVLGFKYKYKYSKF